MRDLYPNTTQSGPEDPPSPPPRLRFAKAQIMKALEALELADSSDLDAWMQVLDLKEQLADQREMTIEWRRKYEALKHLLANGGSGV